jgi:mannonate dehydratase
MKKSETQSGITRRDAMKMITTGSAVGLLGLFESPMVRAEKHETPAYAKGLAPVKIRSVKAIATAPAGSNLIVLKVETTEPGLYNACY